MYIYTYIYIYKQINKETSIHVYIHGFSVLRNVYTTIYIYICTDYTQCPSSNTQYVRQIIIKVWIDNIPSATELPKYLQCKQVLQTLLEATSYPLKGRSIDEMSGTVTKK